MDVADQDIVLVEFMGTEPRKMSASAAAVDLTYTGRDPVELRPFRHATLPTGLRLALPEGYEAQVRPRSGLAHAHGILVVNSPGTIDSDYRGEISVILGHFGDRTVTFKPGDRIAQMVVAPVIRVRFVRVDELSETVRGDQGFGSTGRC